ncbi:hypothetical protein GQ457_04G025330 [Hibiscus cannabinus]
MFVNRNIMPTSHNHTVDRERMVLIHAILNDTRFNIGQVIAKQLYDACKTGRAILAIPCLISALCRVATVPTRSANKYSPLRTGWAKKDYMKKMDITEAISIQVAMSTPSASE